MNKYEYLTDEDLGYKPGVVEQAKFEYSPVGEALNKRLKKMIKSLNKTMIWCIILCIIVINRVCLILKEYHQLTVNLMQ